MTTGNAAATAWNLTDMTDLYKINYGPQSDDAYNSENVSCSNIARSMLPNVDAL